MCVCVCVCCFKRYFTEICSLCVLIVVVILCADSNFKHTVSKSISSGNQDGALQYKNVGEVNPSFFVEQCWLEDNGVAILNLTSPPTIDISLQVMTQMETGVHSWACLGAAYTFSTVISMQ